MNCRSIYPIAYLVLLLIGCLSVATAQEVDGSSHAFVPNQNQWEGHIEFRADIESGALFLEKNAFTYHFYDAAKWGHDHVHNTRRNKDDLRVKQHAFQLFFEGANPEPQLEGKKRLHTFFNYFQGKDRSKWASAVPSYGGVHYEELYPGIDLELYTTGRSLKYDFVLEAGISPHKIKLRYEGLNNISLKDGNLVLRTSLNEIIEQKPVAYQVYLGTEIPIACEFALEGNRLTFSFPEGYDNDLPLVIDPTLIFSTYSGSTANNFGYTATFDSKGFLYSGSTAFGIGYPTTFGGYDTTYNGGNVDIVVSKYDTVGSFLVYSTYLGGNGDELPHSLIVNDQDELYLYGTTGSNDFPVTPLAYDTTFATGNGVNLVNGLGVNFPNGVDMVVSRFSQDGSLLLNSTYLGGTNIDGLNSVNPLKFNYADEVRGEVMIDDNNDVYIASCTRSNDFPIVGPTVQTGYGGGNQDGVVAKLSADLSTIIWSTFLGGSANDAIYSIAIDKNNDFYVAGGTASNNFDADATAYQPTYNGGSADGFITHISADGQTKLHSTLYGSSAYDQVYFVEVDRGGSVYVFGQTQATGNTFVTNAAYSVSNSGQFVSKLQSDLTTLVWSTAFGDGNNAPNISPTAFLVDVCNAIYLSGWGSPIQGGALSTSGLDITNDGFDTTTTGDDFYLMVLADDASALNYATFYGGTQSQEHVDGGTSRFDRKGRIYQSVCAGCGGFDDFPIFPSAASVVSSTNGSNTGCNNGVFKFDFNLPIVVADFSLPPKGCDQYTIQFINTSLDQGTTSYHWDFGDGDTASATDPLHVYNGTGFYTITLIASDTASCNLADTITKKIEIVSDTSWILPSITMCPGDTMQIGLLPANVPPNHDLSWFPITGLSDTTISNPLASPPQSTIYELRLDDGICVDTVFQAVNLDPIAETVLDDTLICSDTGPITLTAFSNGLASTHLWSSNPQFTDTLNSFPNDSSVLVNPTQAFTTFYFQAENGTGCVFRDSLLVTIYDQANTLTADFDIPAVGCLPITLVPNNNTILLLDTKFAWSTSNGQSFTDFEPAIPFDSLGNYTITLIAYDTSICFMTDTLSQLIRVRSDSVYSLPPVLACLDQATTIGIPPLSDTSVTYLWDPPFGLTDPTVSNPEAIITSAQNYTLVIDYGFCRDTVFQTVNVEQISLQGVDDLVFCSTNSPVQITAQSNGSANSILWSTNRNYTDTINQFPADSTINISADPAAPINQYFVRIESPNGCVLEDSALITASDLAIVMSDDTVLCIRDNGVTLLHATELNPAVNYTYDWSPQRYIVNEDQGSIAVDPPVTTYFVLNATDDQGCTFTDSILVQVSRLAGLQVKARISLNPIPIGSITTLFALPDTNIFNYQWTPTTGLSSPNSRVTQAVASTESIEYTVIATDPLVPECSQSDKVTLRTYETVCGEPDIFVPTAFSPNQDGNNDKLFVRGQNIMDMRLVVFDRWGEKVFETKEQGNGWNGDFRGKPLDPAVFVYHLEATCFDEQQFFKKGNVSLLR